MAMSWLKHIDTHDDALSNDKTYDFHDQGLDRQTVLRDRGRVKEESNGSAWSVEIS